MTGDVTVIPILDLRTLRPYEFLFSALLLRFWGCLVCFSLGSGSGLVVFVLGSSFV